MCWPVRRLSYRSLRRCANVHVDLLVAAKPASTKYEQCTHNKDHEDYENCHDAGACCAAATIVCHLFPPDLVSDPNVLRPRLFRLRATSKPRPLHNSNQLPMRNKQMPARSLPAEPDVSSVCRHRT